VARRWRSTHASISWPCNSPTTSATATHVCQRSSAAGHLSVSTPPRAPCPVHLTAIDIRTRSGEHRIALSLFAKYLHTFLKCCTDAPCTTRHRYGFGKAVPGMVAAVDTLLRDHIVSGIASVPFGSTASLAAAAPQLLPKVLKCSSTRSVCPVQPSRPSLAFSPRHHSCGPRTQTQIDTRK
jgi:hypothetical protein